MYPFSVFESSSEPSGDLKVAKIKLKFSYLYHLSLFEKFSFSRVICQQATLSIDLLPGNLIFK